MSNSSRDMLKIKKNNKLELGHMYCTYASSSFISCFTNAQCSHQREHRRHQADIRLHPKRALACHPPPC